MNTLEILHKRIDNLTSKDQEKLLAYLNDVEYKVAEEAFVTERFELLKTNQTNLIDSNKFIKNLRSRAKNE